MSKCIRCGRVHPNIEDTCACCIRYADKAQGGEMSADPQGDYINSLCDRLDDAEGRAVDAEHRAKRFEELYKSACTISEQRRVALEQKAAADIELHKIIEDMEDYDKALCGAVKVLMLKLMTLEDEIFQTFRQEVAELEKAVENFRK